MGFHRLALMAMNRVTVRFARISKRWSCEN